MKAQCLHTEVFGIPLEIHAVHRPGVAPEVERAMVGGVDLWPEIQRNPTLADLRTEIADRLYECDEFEIRDAIESAEAGA